MFSCKAYFGRVVSEYPHDKIHQRTYQKLAHANPEALATDLIR